MKVYIFNIFLILYHYNIYFSNIIPELYPYSEHRIFELTERFPNHDLITMDRSIKYEQSSRTKNNNNYEHYHREDRTNDE
jgi:hypothetical protein